MSNFETLIQISNKIQQEYENQNSIWLDSPFYWIKTKPSRQIGAIGEKFIANLLEAKGFFVKRSNDSDCDRIINDRRIEIKFSTLWESGTYTFQQLRDQNYDFAICLGISPHLAHCWILPKQIILNEWGFNIVSQHGGKKGQDTAWFSCNPMSLPDWLKPYGGTLDEGLEVIDNYLK